MKPRRTHASNTVLRLAGATEDNDLWVERSRENDQPVINSVWELTARERQKVARGANIELTTWGSHTPPVAMRVTTVELGKRPDGAPKHAG